MKLVHPKSFSISAKENQDGTWDMDYEETFPDVELVKSTSDIIRGMLPDGHAKFSNPDPTTMRFEYRGTSMNVISGHIAGEFMNWTTLGQATLADLLGSAMALGVTPKEQP